MIEGRINNCEDKSTKFTEYIHRENRTKLTKEQGGTRGSWVRYWSDHLPTETPTGTAVSIPGHPHESHDIQSGAWSWCLWTCSVPRKLLQHQWPVLNPSQDQRLVAAASSSKHTSAADRPKQGRLRSYSQAILFLVGTMALMAKGPGFWTSSAPGRGLWTETTPFLGTSSVHYEQHTNCGFGTSLNVESQVWLRQ